jgi:hypothetical protein
LNVVSRIGLERRAKCFPLPEFRYIFFLVSAKEG